jgi:hypothetical protein
LAERQDGQQSESGDDGPLSRHGSDSQPVSSMTIAQAQSVLGVKLNATVSVANSGFSKIQQAYRLLLAKS